MTTYSKQHQSMDIHLFNKNLAKISIILDSLDEGSPLSPLERDLLLSYIRDLYDLAIDGQSIIKSVAPSAPKVAAVPQPPVNVAVEKPTPIAAPEPMVEPVPVVVEYVAPLVVEPVAPPAPAQRNENLATPEPSAPQASMQATPAFSLASHPALVRELFDEEIAQDLSEKLSLTPIKDLTKSMGINERVLMLQELFGNNKDHFADTLHQLNNLSGYDEAKQYIVEQLVMKYDWTAEKRVTAAEQFIKLVRRRYM